MILNIPKNKLADFYIRQKLSSYQIAKKFGCSQNTIMERLQSYRIKTRTIQQGKALNPKQLYKRNNFDGTLAEKAYLIGFRLGDMHISKTHPNSPTIRASTNSTRDEQIELVRKLFHKYGHVKAIGPDKNGATNIRCFLNTSFNFLLPKSGVNPWILKSKKYSVAFFAGYVDAEGCFSINYRGGAVFAINSQDKEIMDSIRSHILPSLSINARLHFTRPAGSLRYSIRSNKDVFSIFIYNRKDLLKILSVLLPLIKHRKRRADALKVLKLIK